MKIELGKQPKKFMQKCTPEVYQKINSALDGLEDLKGDIIKMQGTENDYRLKTPPYRILFAWDKPTQKIKVFKIGTRGDVYK